MASRSHIKSPFMMYCGSVNELLLYFWLLHGLFLRPASGAFWGRRRNMQGVYARNVGRRPRMQDACSLHASLVSVWPGIKLAIRLFTSWAQGKRLHIVLYKITKQRTAASASCLYPLCSAWWAVKVDRSRKNCEEDTLCGFKVNQGHRIWHRSEGHKRLPISGYE